MRKWISISNCLFADKRVVFKTKCAVFEGRVGLPGVPLMRQSLLHRHWAPWAYIEFGLYAFTVYKTYIRRSVGFYQNANTPLEKISSCLFLISNAKTAHRDCFGNSLAAAAEIEVDPDQCNILYISVAVHFKQTFFLFIF